MILINPEHPNQTAETLEKVKGSSKEHSPLRGACTERSERARGDNPSLPHAETGKHLVENVFDVDTSDQLFEGKGGRSQMNGGNNGRNSV